MELRLINNPVHTLLGWSTAIPFRPCKLFMHQGHRDTTPPHLLAETRPTGTEKLPETPSRGGWVRTAPPALRCLNCFCESVTIAVRVSVSLLQIVPVRGGETSISLRFLQRLYFPVRPPVFVLPGAQRVTRHFPPKHPCFNTTDPARPTHSTRLRDSRPP